MRIRDTRKGINYILIIVMTSCYSCTRSMNSNNYISYIKNEENGLNKVVKVADWEFDMQYKPYDYILFAEGKGNKTFDKISRLQNLKGTAWFNISFKRAKADKSPLRYDITSWDEYNKRLNYYLSEASGDIELIYDKDTLKPMSYLFETNYNLTPQETIVVGFDLPGRPDRPGKDMQLVFYDRVFGNGIIKTMYTAKVLNNIPDLIY